LISREQMPVSTRIWSICASDASEHERVTGPRTICPRTGNTFIAVGDEVDPNLTICKVKTPHGIRATRRNELGCECTSKFIEIVWGSEVRIRMRKKHLAIGICVPSVLN